MSDGSPCNSAPWPLGSRGTRASGKAKAVDFANDGIARDAAQDAGDLACRKPFGPERLQLLNPFVRPAHIAPPGLSLQNIVPGERLNTRYEVYPPYLVHNKGVGQNQVSGWAGALQMAMSESSGF
jgi:hypothetical protein